MSSDCDTLYCLNLRDPATAQLVLTLILNSLIHTIVLLMFLLILSHSDCHYCCFLFLWFKEIILFFSGKLIPV